MWAIYFDIFNSSQQRYFTLVCIESTTSDMLMVTKDDCDGVPCAAAVTKSLEPLTGQMSNIIATKLTSVEATLKENVTKVVKSKVSCWNSVFSWHEKIWLLQKPCFYNSEITSDYIVQATSIYLYQWINWI